MNIEKVKNSVIEVGKRMYEKGMVNAYEGNVSMRYGDQIIITPTAVCKGILTPDMLCVTDMQGRQMEGTLRPSSEIKLHIAVYERVKEAASVIHCHSPYATAYALARMPIASKAYTEAVVFFDKIPVVDYGAPGTEAITKGLDRFIHQTDVFLLANHGMMAYGQDIYDTFYRAEAVEKTAKTLLFTRLLGGEYPLSEEELGELYAIRKRLFNKGRIE